MQSDDACVRLVYGAEHVGAPSDWLTGELARLVEAEQGCCGAAGVTFELVFEGARCVVAVRVVRDGAPARTVLAAFAGMAPGLDRHAEANTRRRTRS